MSAPTLDRAAFRAWLASKPADDIAGECSSPRACPVANYLNETQPVVGHLWTMPFPIRLWRIPRQPGDGPVAQYPVPGWVNLFIPVMDIETPGLSVTYRQCLAILDAIYEEVPA